MTSEVYDGKRISPLTRGIPQGAVVSPSLANLFLDDLDEQLAEAGQKAVRYCDDFLVLCRDPQAAEEAIEISDALLEQLDLDLNRSKTAITSFDRGFKFLGVVFLGDEVYEPYDRKPKEGAVVRLPPPLDLRRYLELKALSSRETGPPDRS